MLHLALILCSALLPAQGSEKHVPQNFSSIQAAIDVSNHGDRIRVEPNWAPGSGGAYFEDIDFMGLRITVYGVDPNSPGNPITITGTGLGPVVTFASGENPKSVLDGFRIEQGVAAKGGGIYCSQSSPTLINLDVRDNQATEGGGIYMEGSASRVSQCTLQNNSTFVNQGNGAQVFVDAASASPAFHGTLFRGSTTAIPIAEFGAGAYVVGASSTPVRFDACRFQSNWASERGGAVAGMDAWLELTRCHFTSNRAWDGGAVVYVESSLPDPPAFLFESCFARSNDTVNSGANGGALLIATGGQAVVRSSTIRECLAVSSGGAIYVSSGTLLLNSSILYFNSASLGKELALVPSGSSSVQAHVSYSDVELGQPWIPVLGGASLFWGAGNIDLDPEQDFTPDFELELSSPCIGAGDPSLTGPLLKRELPGLPVLAQGLPGELRHNGIIDMGHDEYWDCNGNGTPDYAEGITDCNGNGLEDSCEISLGLELDVDGNGTPDSCQSLGTPYCFADRPLAPCGNYADDAGAQNERGVGARLTAIGSLSLSADDLVVVATGMPSNSWGLLFTGNGATLAFSENGLKCAGMGIKRHLFVQSDSAGLAAFGPGLSSSAHWPAFSSTRYAQVWYRDNMGLCGKTTNFSSALTLPLGP